MSEIELAKAASLQHEPTSWSRLAWILLMALAGLAVAGSGAWWGAAACAGAASGLCAIVSSNPPWVLLSGIAAAPSLLATWYWRTTQRDREVFAKEKENRLKERRDERDANESRANQKAISAQYELARQQQLSARFADAVRLLVHDKLDARVGGIYSLGKIATDSGPSHRDPVIQTLCTFIEANVPRTSAPDFPQPELPDLALCPLDIRAAASVLAELGGARLQRAQLQNANMRAIDLKNAKLMYANLMGADLTGTELQNADLTGACLIGATLVADLTGANLTQAILGGALLIHADDRLPATIHETIFTGATYSVATVFPDGFEPNEHGMVVPEG